MIKYIVGKNDRYTNYHLKYLKSFKRKESWIEPGRIKDPLEKVYHFDTAEEAKTVAKNFNGFVCVIEKKWVWKSAFQRI